MLAGRAVVRVGTGAARSLLLVGIVLLAAHVILLGFHPRSSFLSNLASLLFLLLGVMVCLLGAFDKPPETRSLWLLFGGGLLLASVGQLGFTSYYFVTQVDTQTRAINFDFFFFAYGIPIMLAICSRTADAGLKLFPWLDGAQALIAATLAYLQMFSALPSHHHAQAISATHLMYLDDVENWILIAAVSLRFFQTPARPEIAFIACLRCICG